MTDDNLQYSPEWQVLHKLAKGKGLASIEKVQVDISLNKKINWFLFNGATGVLMLIKEVYGNEGLKEFYSFLDYFMSDVNSLGHYQYSDKIKNDIKATKDVLQGVDFSKFLTGLKQELIELDKRK